MIWRYLLEMERWKNQIYFELGVLLQIKNITNTHARGVGNPTQHRLNKKGRQDSTT